MIWNYDTLMAADLTALTDDELDEVLGAIATTVAKLNSDIDSANNLRQRLTQQRQDLRRLRNDARREIKGRP